MFSLIVVVLFLCVSLLLIAHPKKGLVVLFFLRPLVELSRLEDMSLWGYSTPQIIGVVIPVILTAVLVVRSRWQLKIHPFLLLFLMFSVISLAVQGFDDLILFGRMTSSLPFLVFPQIIVWTDRDILTFVRAVFVSVIFVVAAIILSIGAEALVPHILEVRGQFVSRWGGIFLVPTRTAYWLSIFLVLGIFLFGIDSTSKLKYVYLLTSVFLTLPLYLTFSRTAWLSCALSVLLWQILTRRYRALVITSLLLLGLALTPTGIVDRLFAPDWGGTNRLILWRPAIQMFAESTWAEQLLGVGWSRLSDRLYPYLPTWYPSTGVGITENSFLFVTLGGGLFAGLLFASYWAVVLWISWKLGHYGNSQPKRQFGFLALAMIIMMLVQSLTDDLVLSPVMNWYYYVIAGIAVSLSSTRETKWQARY